jgi:hypothetical protein
MSLIELIFLGILISSFLGMGVVVLRKIPVLTKLPETGQIPGRSLVKRIGGAVKTLPGLKSLPYELYLQKILSKIRVLTMKTENKTANLLEKLRQRANQKNHFENDDYWEELKKAKDGK